MFQAQLQHGDMLRIPMRFVWRILKKLIKLFSYRLQLCQALKLYTVHLSTSQTNRVIFSGEWLFNCQYRKIPTRRFSNEVYGPFVFNDAIVNGVSYFDENNDFFFCYKKINQKISFGKKIVGHQHYKGHDWLHDIISNV